MLSQDFLTSGLFILNGHFVARFLPLLITLAFVHFHWISSYISSYIPTLLMWYFKIHFIYFACFTQVVLQCDKQVSCQQKILCIWPIHFTGIFDRYISLGWKNLEENKEASSHVKNKEAFLVSAVSDTHECLHCRAPPSKERSSGPLWPQLFEYWDRYLKCCLCQWKTIFILVAILAWCQ